MPLYIAQSGDLEGCYRCLTTDSQTLKDSATQLLTKYKSGALVTQLSIYGNSSYNVVFVNIVVIETNMALPHIYCCKDKILYL